MVVLKRDASGAAFDDSRCRRVAYVHDDKILAVGEAHPNRKLLHGHAIQAGYTCVLTNFVASMEVTAPLILGDADENSTLCRDMFFVLPNNKLFTCESYVAGKKVVFHQYLS